MDGLLLCIVFNVKDLDEHLRDLAPRSFWLPVTAFGCLVVHTVEYVTRLSYDNIEKDVDNMPKPEETLELREYVSSAIEDNLHQEATRHSNNNRQLNLLPENPPVYSSLAEVNEIYPDVFNA
uniref:Bestrophin homolog n=1 Tax=Ditylenchus dipsaci TaxID=166011 RepID=A0A915D9A7_9BILA